jgi:hypothetical protein
MARKPDIAQTLAGEIGIAQRSGRIAQLRIKQTG